MFGKVRPNHNGHYIVEDIQTGGKARQPPIKFVTPSRSRYSSDQVSTEYGKRGAENRKYNGSHQSRKMQRRTLL